MNVFHYWIHHFVINARASRGRLTFQQFRLLATVFCLLLLPSLIGPARLLASSQHVDLLRGGQQQQVDPSVADDLQLTPSVDSIGLTTALTDTPTLTATQTLTTVTAIATSGPIPTETPTETPLPTDTATSVPPPTETGTLTFTPAIPTQTETATDTPHPPTQTPTPTDAETPTETPTPIVVGQSAIYISEFMANPAAVGDKVGEYIELFNAGDTAVDLAGWRIEDLGTNKHTIGSELPILSGQYLVLGRSGTLAENGGVAVYYVYTGIDLANGDDEILLLAPDGTTIDSVAWYSSTLPIAAGISWERSDFTIPGSWVAASSPWPGSSGDWGSPGFAYADSTATSTIMPSPTDLSTATPIHTPTPPPTDLTPTASPTPTLTPSETLNPPPAQIRISEFLANPDVVGDEFGEFIELFNAGEAPTNLNGWLLADLDTDNFVINMDLIIQPGQYRVLAHNGDITLNGGLPVDYLFNGMSLANGEDEILLLKPDGQEVDRVVWGDATGYHVTAGASLELTGFDPTATWITAQTPWPGSAGDAGSPGAAYLPPSSTPIPTNAPATSTPIPTEPLPTSAVGPPARIRISEFLANPDAVVDEFGEFIELFNAGDVPSNLNGWILTDLDTDNFVINMDLIIQPGQYLVLARSNDITLNGGLPADYLFGGMSLANGSDEILLLAPDGQEVDRVLWADGTDIKSRAGASLERTSFDDGGVWVTATTPWPGSVGDAGSPGAAYLPPVATPRPTDSLPTPTPTEESIWQPTPGPPPAIFISEFLADPASVTDSDGEFIELFNAGPFPANLRGWHVADLGTEEFTITDDLLIGPAQYLILARNGDSSSNGGMAVDYVYTAMSLANSNDEILLISPAGVEVDRVQWATGSAVVVRSGASLERSAFSRPGTWATAHTAWPGSAGDRGSPGRGYVAPPLEPTGVPTPTASASTPEPTATSPWTGRIPAIYISEFLADPSAVNDGDGEFIELFNADTESINLRGWILADLGANRHVIDADLFVSPGDYLVLGVNGDLAVNGGVPVDYVYRNTNLANGDDEILLLAPNETEVDRVVWGNGSGLSTQRGVSLERTTFGGDYRWVMAGLPWPGSAGDSGTPGSAYVAHGEPPIPTSTPGAPILPPWTGPAEAIVISEFLADPAATNDSDGEYIELFNNDSRPANLRGWILADLGTDRHVIAADLVIQPGAYVVIGRNEERSVNGNVVVAYVYSGISLANSADEILLLAPDESEVDRVAWGSGTGIRSTRGASLERVDPHQDGWVTAQTAWPGSAGDFGSPGTAPDPTPPPDLLPTPTSGPIPEATPTLLPPSGPWPALLISEFLANPAAVADNDGEFVELFNASEEATNLRGWRLGDLDSDLFVVETDLILEAGGFLVLGRNGDIALNGGLPVDYVYGGFTLANSSDEILLIAPDGTEVDRVIWGDGTGLAPSKGASLERAELDPSASWVTAQTPWPGSAGDLGSPGGPPSPDSPPVEATPTLVPAPTPASTAPPSGDTTMVITEFLADSKAVADENGEWVELHNAGASAINLRGWVLADLDTDRHAIDADVLVQPGGYVVLARNGDAMANGGVPVDYVYSGFSLANGADEIVLIAPDGVEVDLVIWGNDSGLRVQAGHSLERVEPVVGAGWVHAQVVWPGSAGDFGSPGVANPAQEPPEPTGTPLPPGVPTPTPAATSFPPAVWQPALSAQPLQIDEVAYQGSDIEFVTLRNISDEPISLSGWALGDAEQAGDGEGMVALPSDRQLAAGERLVIARNGRGFVASFGRPPDAEIEESDPSITTLDKRSDLASGQFALKDSGDEVVLLNGELALADAVAYGSGDLEALNLEGVLDPASGFSLQRAPNSAFDPAIDQRHRFLFARPRPFESVVAPPPALKSAPPLSDGLVAVWGTLGAQSTFSPDHTAPPDYLLAAAAAEGLHFIAIADPYPVTPIQVNGSIIHLPAWRWLGPEEAEAIVYSSQTTAAGDLPGLLSHLQSTGAPAQWVDGKDGPPPAFSFFAADDVAAPGGLTPAWTLWEQAVRSLLPAGNSNPPLPGEVVPQPRFTGLAVGGIDSGNISAALAMGRGWLTTRPGLSLALSAVDDVGNTWWMGDSLAGRNQITLRIEYGDLDGEPAGLAVWQNGKPLHAHQSGGSGSVWHVALPALPDSTLVAVATQADGDFALTAPLHILHESDGRVLISEVMPSPSHDYNGDGETDDDDEFIELFNPGTQPVSLAGWQLSDRRTDELDRYRFVFGDDRSIGGGTRLVLWRSETKLNLDKYDDYVRLIDADGVQVDQFHWAIAPEGGSYSQSDEGGGWQEDTVPTPGGDYGGQHGTGRHEETVVDLTEGQAGGPPGSVAAAKRQGLERWVEFEATVVAPPGLFNSAIYVADPVPFTGDTMGGIGIQVYLRNGLYPPLEEGDRVRVRGLTQSFRGEMEVYLEQPEQIWRLGDGSALAPLPVTVGDIAEPLEGRLVTFSGVVTGWQGDSIYLGDPAISDPAQRKEEAVRVTIRSSLDWKRPYVNIGDRFVATGVVGQFAAEAPWNSGYRVLVRYPSDLERVEGE